MRALRPASTLPQHSSRRRLAVSSARLPRRQRRQQRHSSQPRPRPRRRRPSKASEKAAAGTGLLGTAAPPLPPATTLQSPKAATLAAPTTATLAGAAAAGALIVASPQRPPGNTKLEPLTIAEVGQGTISRLVSNDGSSLIEIIDRLHQTLDPAASEFVDVRTRAGVVGATSVCETTFGLSSAKGRAPQLPHADQTRADCTG